MWLAQFFGLIAILGAAISITGWICLQIGEYRRSKAEDRLVEWLQWRNGDLESLAERMIEERDASRSSRQIVSTR